MDSQTGSLRLMKEMNKSIILDVIKLNEPISRADIAKKTNLSPTTVSTVVDDLIRQEYIEEIGEGDSSGGRKPILLKFHPNGHFVVGVELEGKSISVAITNLRVEIIEKVSRDIESNDESSVVKEISSLIREVADKSRIELERITGIGIGATGLVNVAKGVVMEAVNLSWENVPLKGLIEQEFGGIPIYINNIANAAALGERWAGAGKEAKNLIYVRIGTGIGAGMIFNGKIYEGCNGGAGEIGHMTIEPNGLRCKCGNRGCLEALASGPAIAARAIVGILGGRETLIKELANGSNEEVTAKIVAEAAEKGDRLALGIWKEVGQYLGIAVANLINVYNPEVIIIGGGVAQAGKLLFKPVRWTVKERALPGSARIAKIVPAQLGDRASIIGAAALVLERVFKVCI